ncbi:MAG: DedA family protein [Gammaproteobacteria bacterium]|nr:DedA family protein [Gammaproteobacteria bacterium]
MRIFSGLYERALSWAKHPHATRYLGLLSFSESSFFPIPPDVMLAPMVLAQPQRAWSLAALTTAASVLGGIAGYLIGALLFNEIGQPVVEFYQAHDAFEKVKAWFAAYGLWIVFLAGFTPIPYKLFTIASGVLALPMVPFVLASLVGRGARFFLVAGLLFWGGERLEKFLKTRVDQIGWATVGIVVVAAVFLKLVR